MLAARKWKSIISRRKAEKLLFLSELPSNFSLLFFRGADSPISIYMHILLAILSTSLFFLKEFAALRSVWLSWYLFFTTCFGSNHLQMNLCHFFSTRWCVHNLYLLSVLSYGVEVLSAAHCLYVIVFVSHRWNGVAYSSNMDTACVSLSMTFYPLELMPSICRNPFWEFCFFSLSLSFLSPYARLCRRLGGYIKW